MAQTSSPALDAVSEEVGGGERAVAIQRVFKGCLWPGHLCSAACLGLAALLERGALGMPWGKSQTAAPHPLSWL